MRKSFEELLALTSDVECVFGAQSHPGLIRKAENLPTVDELMGTAVRAGDVAELSGVANHLECRGLLVIRLPGDRGLCRAINGSLFEPLCRDEEINIACLSSTSPRSGGPTLVEQFLSCYVELYVNATTWLSKAAAYMVLARDLVTRGLLHPDLRGLPKETLALGDSPLDSVHQVEALAWSAARICPDRRLISQFASELDEWLESAETRGLRGAQLAAAFDAEQAMLPWRELKGFEENAKGTGRQSRG